jgi:PAT family beta-lactamase induction signal transducer AmpG
MPRKNLLHSRTGRLTTFGLLYISEGIPYGFSSIAMVAIMRTAGLSLEQIGTFVAALILPWSFKWLWAPVVDVVTLNRIGGRKAWIMICTSMMIVTLVFTATVDFVADFQWLLVMVVLNNFFCATQDVAIDSLAVSTLHEDEWGIGNGIMFGGQYLGITLGGGGAFFAFGMWGLDVTLIYVSSVLALELMFVFFFIADPAAANPAVARVDNALRKLASTLSAFVREVYVSFFRSGVGPKIGLLFSVLPIGAMALAYATLGTLQVDYGLTDFQIAQISVYHTITTGVGCVVGGMLASRYGIKKMLALYYFLTAVPTAFLALRISQLGLANVPLHEFYGAVLFHGLLFGMAFGQKAAIFMGMTNPAVAATQFTAFMAMSNLIISLCNYWTGMVAERFDYSLVLFIDSLLVIFPLTVIPFLRKREDPPELSEPALAAVHS